MALKGKQKRVLRSMGQLMDPVVFVGKDGMSESVVHTTDEMLAKRELIKVRVLNNSPYESTDFVADLLSARTASEVAGRVGHTFLLYRPNPELDNPIVLPQPKEETE